MAATSFFFRVRGSHFGSLKLAQADVAASIAVGVARRNRSLGGSLRRGTVCARVWPGREWSGARDPVDRPRPDPHVVPHV
jgi:hypothetical protein